METDDNAMISIRPNHAKNIVDGAKTVELRRRFLPLPHGSKLWIYSTLPVGALVAKAIICSIDYDEPEALWLRYQREVAVSKKIFFDYFADCKVGCAIRLTKIEPIAPVSLASIRKVRGVNHIPQVATKITAFEARQFESLSYLGDYET
jgi:predicted transcriptional regulator